MPVFNCEDYILESVKSVINNSFRNFEIIIINDGSTDSSLDLIKSVKDDRIKIFNKINSGLIETLNYGIKKCNSEIIMRMDADDIIDLHKINKQLKVFISTDSILLGTQGYIIDKKGKVIGNINLPLNNNEIKRALNSISPSFIHPSIMFYKDALLKLGGYNKFFKHAEDYEMFMRIGKIGKLSNIKDRLIYLRKHDNNISHQNANEQIENTLIAKQFYNSNSKNKISEKNYLIYKKKVKKSFLKKNYVKIHAKIVKKEFLDIKSNLLFTLLLKLFRRILKRII